MMRILLILLWASLLAWPAPGRAQGAETDFATGIVSLQVTNQGYDAAFPWNKHREQQIAGNALVVTGPFLLTAADMVKNATLILVRKFGAYPDFTADLVKVDYQLNLALLRVDDPAFWAGLQPLPISEQPLLQGRFGIKRWRHNGRFEQGSGEVVEYRMATSRFGDLDLPQLRGASSMSGLGWSEVLTHDAAAIGLVTGHNGQELVALTGHSLALFVKAAQAPQQRSFAHRGFSWQALNSEAMKAHFGQARDDPGVLIRRMYAGGTGHRLLREGDILKRIGDHDIDPEGQIRHPAFGTVAFTIAVNDALGPTINVDILRDGKPLRLQLQRERFTEDTYRIAPYEFDEAPDYQVFGGLVVQELTRDYLQRWGANWRTQAPARLLIEHDLASLRDADSPVEKVVFVSRVLPDPVNIGYEDLRNAIVTALNGIPIRDLASFRQAMDKPQGDFHVLQLLPGQGRSTVVFRATELARAGDRISQLYGVPQRH